jgi:hypothetical protein
MVILRRMSERGPSSAQSSIINSHGPALGSLTPQQMKQMQRIQEALRGGSAGPASVLSGDSDYSPNSSAFPSRGGFGFALGPAPPGVKEHKVKVEPMFPRMAAMEKMKRKNTASSNRSPAPSAANRRKASPASSVRSRLPSPSPSVRSTATVTRGRKPSTALPGKRQTQERAARDGSAPLQNAKRVKSASAIKSVSRSPASSRPPPSPARSTSRGPSPMHGIASSSMRPVSVNNKRDRAVSHVAPSPSPVRPATSGARSAQTTSPMPHLKSLSLQSSPASSLIASPQASVSASPRPPRPESVKKSSIKSTPDSGRKSTKTAIPEKEKKQTPAKKPIPQKQLPAVQPIAKKVLEVKSAVSSTKGQKTHLPTISEPVVSVSSATVSAKILSGSSLMPSKPTALPHPSRSLPKATTHIAPTASKESDLLPVVTPLSPLTVKVSVSGSVYRLHLERATIANLSSTLAKAVPTVIKSFTFIDDEGDVVTLHDDHNLLEALSVSKSSGKIARFDALTENIPSNVSLSNMTTTSTIATTDTPASTVHNTSTSSYSVSASVPSKSVAFDMSGDSSSSSSATSSSSLSSIIVKSNVPGLDPSVMVPSVFPISSADSLTPSRKVPYRPIRSPSPRADLDRIQMAMGGSIGGGVRSASPSVSTATAYTDAPRSRTPIEPAYASYESISSSAKANYSPLRSHFESIK